jgi:hypothetical protein
VNCSRTPAGEKKNNGQPGQACDPARPAGSSPATWAELGPAQKKYIKIKKNRKVKKVEKIKNVYV